MGWFGYEATGQSDEPARICQMTINLHGWRQGASSVELQMGDSGGPLPERADDRRRLAEALKREVATAVRRASPRLDLTTTPVSTPQFISVFRFR